ncbi:MAG: hypothetical protein MJB14_16475 [Spirochaetes bacterium]|nr:hypothetical protein [Spirochaetota bacterium]
MKITGALETHYGSQKLFKRMTVSSIKIYQKGQKWINWFLVLIIADFFLKKYLC